MYVAYALIAYLKRNIITYLARNCFNFSVKIRILMPFKVLKIANGPFASLLYPTNQGRFRCHVIVRLSHSGQIGLTKQWRIWSILSFKV